MFGGMPFASSALRSAGWALGFGGAVKIGCGFLGGAVSFEAVGAGAGVAGRAVGAGAGVAGRAGASVCFALAGAGAVAGLPGPGAGAGEGEAAGFAAAGAGAGAGGGSAALDAVEVFDDGEDGSPVDVVLMTQPCVVVPKTSRVERRKNCFMGAAPR